MGKKEQIGETKTPPVDAFIQSLDLIDIRLVEGRCSQAIKEGPLPSISNLNVEVTTARSDSESRIRIIMQFTMAVSYDDSPNQAAVLIVAKFQMMFKSSNIKLATQDVISPFAQGAAVFIMWPYWREFVNNSNSRMGLPQFSVPLLKAGYLKPDDWKGSPVSGDPKRASRRRREPTKR